MSAAPVGTLFRGRRADEATDALPPEYAFILAIWRRVILDATSTLDDRRQDALAFLGDPDALAFWAEAVFLIPLEQLQTAIQATLHPASTSP